MRITFDTPSAMKDGFVIVPVSEGMKPPCKNGVAAKTWKRYGFEGKRDQKCTVTIDDKTIIFVGAGKEDTPLSFQEIGGEIASIIRHLKGENVSITLCSINENTKEEDVAAHIAFGVGLGLYTFDVYKSEKSKFPQDISILTDVPAKAEKVFAPLAQIIDSVYETRDMVSEPGNMLYPAEFVDIAKQIPGLELEVINVKQMEKEGLNLIINVGKGSIYEPYLLIAKYMNGGKKAPLMLVGKGVTFDTGGIDLKPGKDMGDMKYDMSSAAAVLWTMAVVAKRKPKANIVALMPLVENMISSKAYRPGDVIESYSGKTVEIDNTDAEGRLILADALSYGQEKFKPGTVIDLGTLTAGSTYVLGKEFAPIYSNNEELADALIKAGKETVSEKLWPMPLHKSFDKILNSDIADMRNTASTPEASSSCAAQFLKRFINDDVKWAHVEMAGLGWTKKDIPCTPKGATGFGVQLLVKYIEGMGK